MYELEVNTDASLTVYDENGKYLINSNNEASDMAFNLEAGGYGAGKMLRKEKYLWGLLVGSCYFFLLLMVSVLAGGKPDMTMKHMITTFFLCLGGGTLGGMLS